MSDKLKVTDCTGGAVTYWNVADMFNKFAEVLRKIPNATWVELKDFEQKSLEEMATLMRDMLIEIQRREKTLGDVYSKYVDESEKTFRLISAAHTKMRKNIGALPDVTVPYGLGKMVEFVQQFNSLTDEQWARMIELAKALK